MVSLTSICLMEIIMDHRQIPILPIIVEDVAVITTVLLADVAIPVQSNAVLLPAEGAEDAQVITTVQLERVVM